MTPIETVLIVLCCANSAVLTWLCLAFAESRGRQARAIQRGASTREFHEQLFRALANGGIEYRGEGPSGPVFGGVPLPKRPKLEVVGDEHRASKRT